MVYSLFHFIINSLSASLQLNPTGFWKPSPAAKGVEKLCGMLAWKGTWAEKPAEMFYPLVRGKIRDLVALKQANKFPATPNLKKCSFHPRQEGYLWNCILVRTAGHSIPLLKYCKFMNDEKNRHLAKISIFIWKSKWSACLNAEMAFQWLLGAITALMWSKLSSEQGFTVAAADFLPQQLRVSLLVLSQAVRTAPILLQGGLVLKPTTLWAEGNFLPWVLVLQRTRREIRAKFLPLHEPEGGWEEAEAWAAP